MMTTNIGVMGGTFDPVHRGHLAVADEARRLLDLAEVIFMPAGHPYFKDAGSISPAEDRVNMLKLAVSGQPYYKISLMEVMRPGPSYAVDSISRMKRQLNSGEEIFFIMGWDSVMTLPHWEQPQRLLSLCKIVASPRPGYPPPDMSLLEKELPGITQRTVVMDRPLIEISSTEIRERVGRGLPVYEMVPAPVARYIRQKGLYRPGTSSRSTQ